MLVTYRCRQCDYWVMTESEMAAAGGTPVCPRHVKPLRPVAESPAPYPAPSSEPAPPPGEVEAFRPELINASPDIGELADRLAETKVTPGPRLLLSGPPGTGKSAYVRHLAQRLGLVAQTVSYGEIASHYVGETEKTIRAVFDAAGAANRFVILDEADSLLRSRALAQNSWERTQVNELLQALDRLTSPIALTTNDLGEIDPAVMRRIDFKVRFAPLDSHTQLAAAFEHFFGLGLPAGNDLETLNLTPGDFAVVRRRPR